MEASIQEQQPVEKKSWFHWNASSLSFATNKGLYLIAGLFIFASVGSTMYILSLPSPNKQPGLLSLHSAGALSQKPSPIPSLTQKAAKILSPTPARIAPIAIVTLPPNKFVILSSTPATSGWNTFSTLTYGFSIQYPSDWVASDSGQLEPKVPDYIIFNPKTLPNTSLSITLSYSTRTYDQALAIDPQTGTQISVASVSATQKTQTDSDGNVTVNVIVPFKNSTTLILVAQQQYKNILTQMLETLKFL